jgi:UPF0176 protein
MQKIILYYCFTPVTDPEAVRLWQHTLCERLGLKGRIIIAAHGINGTLGGELSALKAYAKATREYFKTIEFKWGDGGAGDFPKLSVKVRPEIVTFGAADRIRVNNKGIVSGGRKLKPKQLHELVKRKDVVFFDGRNRHEAAVGRFKGAVVPNVDHSRDFVKELDDPKYDAIRDKPIVTYCTGGIRCEVLSVLMQQRGFKEVYQLDGGIVRYGEEYADNGLWEGALYVFDGRVTTKFSDAGKDIGSCIHCSGPTSTYYNCANKTCNALMLVCADCQHKNFCTNCTAQPTAV